MPTSKGNFAGVELALVTTVTTTPSDARVTGVQLQTCNGGTLGSAQTIDAGNWPVGAGDNGTAAVETYVPLASLGTTNLIRVAVASLSAASGADAIVTAPGGGPILISLGTDPGGAAQIPTLSGPFLVLLAASLGLVGYLVLRAFPGARTWVVAGLLLAGAATLLAVSGGWQLVDWTGKSSIGTDPKGNGPVDADLVSLYAQVSQGKLFFRVDADVRPDTIAPTPTPTPTATPVVTLDPVSNQSIPTNTTLSLRLAGHSTDALATLTYAVVTGPGGASVVPGTGIFGFTPGQGQLGNQSVTVKVQDTGGRSAQRTFQVGVIDHNHPPVLGALTDDLTAVGTHYTKTLTAVDPDAGDVLTFSLVSGPAGMTLTGSQLTWTPTAAQLGNWPVQVKVTDRAGASDSGKFHVGIPLVQAIDDHYEVKIGQTLTVAAPGILGNDVDPLPTAMVATKLTDPDKGTLTAFGSNGSFTYQAPPAIGKAFQPVLKPGWITHSGIDGDGGPGNLRVVDVDGDGRPEIIAERSHGAGWGASRISALRGTDGSTLWYTNGFYLPAPNDNCVYATGIMPDELAVGDIDDSGHPAIILPVECPGGPNPSGPGHGTNRLAALDGRNGTLKWLSPELSVPDSNGIYWQMTSGTTPAIARLRQGESPSVLFQRTISGWDNSGKYECNYYGANIPECTVVTAVDGATGALRQRWFAAASAASPIGAGGHEEAGPVMVADLTGSGSPNVIAGSAVWDVNGALLVNTVSDRGVYSLALANLDDTGQTAIISYESAGGWDGWVIARKPDGTVLWKSPTSATTMVGELVVADLYGDGRPKVLASAAGYLYAFDEHGSLVWSHRFYDAANNPAIEYHNRPAVFDLDGDGVPEVIVQTSWGIEFFDGKTGVQKANVTYESLGFPLVGGTTIAGFSDRLGPLVVDVDGDGHAEVLFNIVANYYPVNSWAVALQSQTNDWQPARPVWNQFGMHDANVADDGRIPQVEINNFKTTRTNVWANPARVAPAVDPRKREQARFTYQAAAGGYTSSPANVTIDILPPNRPPIFTSTTPTTYQPYHATGYPPFPPYVPFVYQAQATDPDVGDTLTYSIVTRGGSDSSAFSIDPATGKVTAGTLYGGSVNPDQWATQYLVIAVTDSWGASAFQTLTLRPGARPAVVPSVVGQQKSAADAILSGAGFGTGTLTQVVDPAPAGQVLTQFPLAGSSALLGELVALTVSLGPPVVLPPGPPPDLGNLARIAVTPSSALRVTGETVPFKAIGTNTDGTGSDITAYVAWTSSQSAVATVDAAGVAHAATAGTTTVTASASGLSATALLTVAARSPGDSTPPSAIITAPAGGGTVTGLTQVLGTATDAHFLRYELALQASGDTTFTAFVDGTSPVTSGVLGMLDPTLLLNGAYTLRLTVWDANGNTVSAEVPIVVDGAMKVGSFTISYTDMTVLLSGIPIQITRTYDSRDKRTGDFGVGWSLGVKALRVSASGIQGTGWQVVQAGTSWALVPGTDHFVSVTLPSGKVETFDLRLTPASSFLVPFSTLQARFVPRSGVLGTLQSLDNTNILIADPQPGPVTLLDDVTLNAFHPDKFLYTQKDGTQFVVRRTKGVESVKDTNGNQITLGPGGITHSAGLGITFGRDALGRITSITDLKGHSRTYATSAAGDLVSATDRTGNTTQYAYDVTHGLLKIIDPLGRPVSRADYDDQGRLVSLTDALGHTTTYHHDVPGRVEQVEDPLGRITVVGYDERGNVLSKTDPLGRTTTATYDARDNQLTVTSPLGRVTSATYDAQNNLTSVTDPLGRTSHYTYDAAGNPLTSTNARGQTPIAQYDASGNIVSHTDPLGHTSSFGNGTGGNPTTLTSPGGTTSLNGYDPLGRRTKLTNARGDVVSMQYDANGTLVSQQEGGAGFTSTHAYDAEGRIVGITAGGLQRSVAYDETGHVSTVQTSRNQQVAVAIDPAGRMTGIVDSTGATRVQQTYDAVGNPVSVADTLGNQTTRTYDAANQPIAATLPGGATESRVFDGDGNLTRYTDALGRTTVFGYDAAGELVSITDALGRQTVFQFDANGNRTSQTDPAGHTTHYAYDELDRLTTTTFADGTAETRTYDADGRLATLTDAGGGVTTYAYDAGGNLISITDPLGHVTQHAYQGGQRISTTDANGHTNLFAYDSAGRPAGTTHALGDSETVAYDVTGSQISESNGAGETVQAQYDARGRLAKVVFPDGTSYASTYTTDNLVSSIVGPDGTTLFSYDSVTRRLARVTQPDGQYVRYATDVLGNRTLMAHGDPASERVTTYAYDLLNRLTRTTDPNGGVTTQTYDVAGNVASIARPNGVTTTTTYDARNRPLTITETSPGPTTLSRETYTLDALGNRTRVDRLDGSHVEYQYDPLGRIVREKRFGTSATLQIDLAYAYDPAGNLVSAGPAGAPVAYQFNANDQLVSGGGVTYTYDLAGRRTKESWTQGASTLFRSYAWDAADRLSAFRDETGATTTYAYDDQGSRRAKGGATGAVSFLVDPEGLTGFSQLLRESSPSGTNTYVWGDRLLQTFEVGTQRYHLFDALGSTRALVAGTGLVTDTFDYDAWGGLLDHSGTSGARHRFAGEETDLESGLSYLRARYYDPRTRTFLTRDPGAGSAAEPLSLHPYLYASGNPVNRTDPSGAETLLELSITQAIDKINEAYGQIQDLRKLAGRAKDVQVKVAREVGGLWALLAVLETIENDDHVAKWFNTAYLARKAGKAARVARSWVVNPEIAGVIAAGNAIGKALDVTATLYLASTSLDMLGGRKVDISIAGWGALLAGTGDILDDIKRQQTVAETVGSCKSGTFAMAGTKTTTGVPLSVPVLAVCGAYWWQPFVPTSTSITFWGNEPSQPGIMVHEFTHITLKTKDHDYGCKPATSLLLSSGKLAVRNADSYRCWTEESVLGFGDKLKHPAGKSWWQTR